MNLFSNLLVLPILSQLSIIGGLPNVDLPWVAKTVGKVQEIAPSVGPINLMTSIASILSDHQVNSATWYQILKEDLSSENEWVHQAIAKTKGEARVVFLTVGPHTNDICTRMAAMKSTVFVLGSGKNGARLDGHTTPKCRAKNILIVAGLNQRTDSLLPGSNFGPIVRLAAPAYRILVRENDDAIHTRSAPIYGAARVAARLMQFVRDHPSAGKGETLIDLFFQNETDSLESLRGMIQEGRVLRPR